MRDGLAHYGITAPDEVIVKAMGDWADLVAHGSLPAELLEGYAVYTRKLAHERLQDAPLYDGVSEALRRLKTRKKPAAIVTAGYRAGVEMMLARHQLADNFGVIISGTDIHKQKPHPEGILLALRKLGASPEARAVMVGDNVRDLLAAQNASIDSVLFYPKSHELLYNLADLHVHKPTRIIRTWHDFLPER